jgi:hypothetical protein
MIVDESFYMESDFVGTSDHGPRFCDVDRKRFCVNSHVNSVPRPNAETLCKRCQRARRVACVLFRLPSPFQP